MRIALLGLVASHACCTWLGWELRDRNADLAAMRLQAAQETGRADTALVARRRNCPICRLPTTTRCCATTLPWRASTTNWPTRCAPCCAASAASTASPSMVQHR
ncbi:hypothetical protein [Stenotrophomonas indicatrix]|uniref:hypothetical protein n=1 Tax=Stenotrophomonas indicatrix TaxID=2045451 RepID=UPI001CBA70F3|nr:hypothetical protein [Stenotrophomonas indicatrix]